MRAIDFYRQRLDEIMMSPRSLRKEASAITGALVGMEFEMYVPNVGDPDDAEFEPDYDMDESASSIDEIINFFDNQDSGGYNSSRQLRRLREALTEQYDEWVQDQMNDEWRSEGKEIMSDYIANNTWDEDEKILEALDEMGLSDEEVAAAKEAGEGNNEDEAAVHHWKIAKHNANQAFEALVDEEWENEGDAYDEAKDEWEQEYIQPDDGDFLSDQGYNGMSDIENSFDISWPYLRQVGGEGDYAEVASSFRSFIKKDVKHGEDYHSVRRDNRSYILEPDGSLDEPANNDDKGLEFVSPPMPIADMLTDLANVKKWAEYTGCYTNQSTGLHINISIPGFSIDKLDFVKLVLLLGDEYVLRNFNRYGNDYAPPAIDKIKQNISNRREDAEGLLQSMHSGLSQIASKAIHGGHTNKYCSINTKDGYVEFRSPGEDWLGENFEKIESTMLRMVVALDAACNREKYQQEYAKKLYKLLTYQQMGRRADTGELKQAPDMNDNDIISVFSQYSAGKLPRAALKSFVKSFQMQRNKEKMRPDDNLAPMQNVPIPGNQVPLHRPRLSDVEGRWLVYNSNDQYASVTCLRSNAVHAAMNQNPELFPHGVPSVDRVEPAPTMTQGELNLSDFGPEYADNGPVTSKTRWWFKVAVAGRSAQTVAARTTQEARDKAREEFGDMKIQNEDMVVSVIRRVEPISTGVVDRSNNGKF